MIIVSQGATKSGTTLAFEMTRATLETAGKLVQEWTPTRRLGGEEDLKGLAVLLASEASRHITGQAIAVDGGATIV